MSEKSTLTEADRHALGRMPNGWFDADNLPPIVRCPRYRCERLKDRGVLEWRVIGEYPNLKSEWRKINPTAVAEGEVEG